VGIYGAPFQTEKAAQSSEESAGNTQPFMDWNSAIRQAQKPIQILPFCPFDDLLQLFFREVDHIFSRVYPAARTESLLELKGMRAKIVAPLPGCDLIDNSLGTSAKSRKYRRV
jgi:hypothetical protein